MRFFITACLAFASLHSQCQAQAITLPAASTPAVTGVTDASSATGIPTIGGTDAGLGSSPSLPTGVTEATTVSGASLPTGITGETAASTVSGASLPTGVTEPSGSTGASGATASSGATLPTGVTEGHSAKPTTASGNTTAEPGDGKTAIERHCRKVCHGKVVCVTRCEIKSRIQCTEAKAKNQKILPKLCRDEDGGEPIMMDKSKDTGKGSRR